MGPALGSRVTALCESLASIGPRAPRASGCSLLIVRDPRCFGGQRLESRLAPALCPGELPLSERPWSGQYKSMPS